MEAELGKTCGLQREGRWGNLSLLRAGTRKALYGIRLSIPFCGEQIRSTFPLTEFCGFACRYSAHAKH